MKKVYLVSVFCFPVKKSFKDYRNSLPGFRNSRMNCFKNLCGHKYLTPLHYKNGFVIFSEKVAVGSKGELMVQCAMFAIAVAVRAISASMWAVTSFTSEVKASMHYANALCWLLYPLRRLLHTLYMMYMRYVGCCILYVGCYSLYA